ncbi:MAG: DUF1045 domain-containing protein [Cohaesibacteraceae bacterium]|nr:DUF1045 domain-containing protein [Cohaesibacteraceae bacterium]
MRFGIYFTPTECSELLTTGSNWLGRNVFQKPVKEFSGDHWLGWKERNILVASAVRYGFHGTFKAPFSLAPGMRKEHLISEFKNFCKNNISPGEVKLKLGQIGPFFALVPDGACNKLNHFANSIVEVFEPFRAPLTPADIDRRHSHKLNQSEEENFHKWGYPYVFDTFQFHMTLTGPVAPGRVDAVWNSLTERFRTALINPVPINSLAIYCESEPGSNFKLEAFSVLNGSDKG